MPQEIERKFLVSSDLWRRSVVRQARFRQGYMARSATTSLRVRCSVRDAWLNLKSVTLGVSRDEYEYPIPLVDAEAMLATLVIGPVIDKTRHWVEHAGFEWEVDVFHGANQGLIVAEIELDREDRTFERPAWVGKEVTQYERYYNIFLVEHPYCEWSRAEREP